MSDNFDDYGDYYEEYDDSYGAVAEPAAENAWDEDDLIAGVREDGDGVANGQDDANGQPRSNRRKIIFGAIFVLVILPLFCFVCMFLFGGAAMVSALFSGEGLASLSEEGEPEATPIATFVPTAAVIVAPTDTPEPTLIPTMAPPSATFLSPENNAQIVLGESIEIVVEVRDPNGITSLSIAGSGVSPKTFSGETEVTFRERWSPENPGQFTFDVILRNRASTALITLDGITVTVVTGNDNDTESSGE